MKAAPALFCVVLAVVWPARGQPLPTPDDHDARQTTQLKAAKLAVRALALYRQGQPAQAAAAAEQALALYEQLFPPARFPDGHPELAAALNNVGFLLQASGALAQAEPYLRRALAMREKLYPPARFPTGQADVALSLTNLGLLLRERGDLAGAEPYLRRALALLRQLYPAERFPQGHRDLAEALYELAMVLHLRGDRDRAEPLYREALVLLRQLYPPERFPQGNSMLASTLNRLGQLLEERRELAQAEPLLREALALRRKLYPPDRYPDGHPHLASSLTMLGSLLQARGELMQAEPYFRQALAMYEKLYPAERFPRGHRDLAGAFNNLGVLLQLRGEPALAEPHFRRAVAIWQRLYPPDRFPDGHPDLARGLSNVGFALRARGELAQAEPYYRRALAMRERLCPAQRFPAGHPDLAQSLNNLGALLQARGELAQAESCFRQALTMRERLYPVQRFPLGHPDLINSLSNLGFLHEARGELAQAEAYDRRALALNEKRFPVERFPRGHPALADSLNNLGFVLLARGDLVQAEPLYRRALAMRERLYPVERYPAGHPDLAASLNNLGSLLRERGELTQAELLLRQALAMYEKLYPAERFPQGHPELANSLTSLGGLLAAQSDLVKAEPLLRRALDLRQRQLQALLAGSSEAEVLNHLARLPLTRDLYLSVAHGRPDMALAACTAAWQAHGVVARWLSQRRLAAVAAADPRGRALAQKLAETRQRLAALLLARGPLSDEQAKRVRALSEDKERLEKELAAALPAFAQALQATGATPTNLGKRLPEGAVYVDLLRYHRFEHDAKNPGKSGTRQTPSYVAFVLRRGGAVRRVELGPARMIDKAVTAWRAALTANPKSEIRNPKAERPEMVLRRLVWDKLAGHLPEGTATVYLCPDAGLTALPWAALPGAKAGTVLLEDYALAVVPHGQLLAEQLASQGRQPSEAGTLLAVGGVAYGPADAKGAWRALPGTERELEGVVALAGKRPVLVRRGKEATTGHVLHDLATARWAHLATHGFFAGPALQSVLQLRAAEDGRGGPGERVGVGARSPLVLSGLVLAGANVPAEEAGGILTAEAIAGLHLDGLELAVLSACETGLGEVAGGEGVFGLQRAFHIAGCKNVIASLWQVDDEATAALMGLFYHHLWQEGKSPLEALRQAQLTLYCHPERMPQLARARGPDFDKAARLPAASGAASARRAPPRLWAGFVLSGAGR
jgi:CHAT domain-containing protein/Tfp pilus assembly protein PilF